MATSWEDPSASSSSSWAIRPRSVPYLTAVVGGVPSQAPSIPPVTEDAGDHVGPSPEQRSDVVGRGQQAMSIAGPTRIEQFVGYGCSVDRHPMHPKRGDVEPRLDHFGRSLEFAPNHRRWRLAFRPGIVRQSHRLCDPVRCFEQACLHLQDRAPVRPTILGGDTHPKMTNLSALHRRCRVPATAIWSLDSTTPLVAKISAKSAVSDVSIS